MEVFVLACGAVDPATVINRTELRNQVSNAITEVRSRFNKCRGDDKRMFEKYGSYLQEKTFRFHVTILQPEALRGRPPIKFEDLSWFEQKKFAQPLVNHGPQMLLVASLLAYYKAVDRTTYEALREIRECAPSSSRGDADINCPFSDPFSPEEALGLFIQNKWTRRSWTISGRKSEEAMQEVWS